MKKLKNTHGETIVEALVSVLIVALCFVALQGSIVASAKVNSQAKEMIRNFTISDSDTVDSSASVTIKRNSGSTKTNIQVKKSQDGNYYYF